MLHATSEVGDFPKFVKQTGNRGRPPSPAFARFINLPFHPTVSFPSGRHSAFAVFHHQEAWSSTQVSLCYTWRPTVCTQFPALSNFSWTTSFTPLAVVLDISNEKEAIRGSLRPGIHQPPPRAGCRLEPKRAYLGPQHGPACPCTAGRTPRRTPSPPSLWTALRRGDWSHSQQDRRGWSLWPCSTDKQAPRADPHCATSRG